MPSLILQLISIEGELCIRGYWNTPPDVSKTKTSQLDWFAGQIRKIGISDLKDTLYFPQISGKPSVASFLIFYCFIL